MPRAFNRSFTVVVIQQRKSRLTKMDYMSLDASQNLTSVKAFFQELLVFLNHFVFIEKEIYTL